MVSPGKKGEAGSPTLAAQVLPFKGGYCEEEQPISSKNSSCTGHPGQRGGELGTSVAICGGSIRMSPTGQWVGSAARK